MSPAEARPVRTVRDATFDVLRRTGMTTIFANPGSTEVSLLAGFPDDLEFVLALHEGSVVGMATGWAIARERPALALLHTTAGLGNAVGAIATARVNRAPLVVLVGQQDRRHLALEPFLTGRLAGLAGDYPVRVDQPARAQDVPGAVARACHEAVTSRGPALVVVPMDDWSAPADDDWSLPPEDGAGAGRAGGGTAASSRGTGRAGGGMLAAPLRVIRPTAVADADLEPLVALLAEARSPVLVVGAGADSAEAWRALTALAERLRCPVWQESFGARAGFPQDHPQFAGILPAGRSRLREVLAGHDAVLTAGAPVFRQYPYEPGPLVAPGTAVAVVTDDPAEAHRSPADLALLASPAVVCARLAALLPARSTAVPPLPPRALPPDPPLRDEPLRAAHVLHELALRLAPETVVVEETPSSRPDLHRLLPARRPLGFLSAAMGGLGFALPAAVGLRMAAPDRPVVAVVGDGSALYGIQALWSAAHYGVGALFVVLANGRYAVMDRLAERADVGKAPWPPFTEVRMAGMARSLGCPARRVEAYYELADVLDEVVPGLAGRREPLLLDVAVVPDPDFQP
ncbi:thiamine pyrophosphate-binding protein [Streptosporangium sp. NBC_01495]|uniref:thiamine pyrophosphate-dependent enzyme n=1 Tax=Streptosporangium sp. NBC_01495 TaxID=2903899 RepID=UPI002E351337|nr:thiamine pyrophosphate-dependent enzyme [Streptosporangium sp. NBC_01495]